MGGSNLVMILMYRRSRPEIAICAAASWWWIITVTIVASVYMVLVGAVVIGLGILGMFTHRPGLLLGLAMSPIAVVIVPFFGNAVVAMVAELLNRRYRYPLVRRKWFVAVCGWLASSGVFATTIAEAKAIARAV